MRRLANGAFAHALELDDDHRDRRAASGRGGGAGGACRRRGGRSDGADVPARAARRLRGRLPARRGLPRQPVRSCPASHGALRQSSGAAAAAAVAMGLDRDAFVRALGIAGTQASGLTEWRADGSWIKRLHPGRAAHARRSRRAARARGLHRAPPPSSRAMEASSAPSRTARRSIPNAMTRGLGSDFRALGTARQALSLLPLRAWRDRSRPSTPRRRASPPPTSERVAIRIYRTNVLSYHHEPRNAVDAQFNVPYAVALALVRGAVRLADFTEEAIKAPDVLAFARRIDVREDPEFTAKYPQDYFVELKVRAARRRREELPERMPERRSGRGTVPGRIRALLQRGGREEGRRAARRVRLRRSRGGAAALRDGAADGRRRSASCAGVLGRPSSECGAAAANQKEMTRNESRPLHRHAVPAGDRRRRRASRR